MVNKSMRSEMLLGRNLDFAFTMYSYMVLIVYNESIMILCVLFEN